MAVGITEDFINCDIFESKAQQIIWLFDKLSGLMVAEGPDASTSRTVRVEAQIQKGIVRFASKPLDVMKTGKDDFKLIVGFVE